MLIPPNVEDKSFYLDVLSINSQVVQQIAFNLDIKCHFFGLEKLDKNDPSKQLPRHATVCSDIPTASNCYQLITSIVGLQAWVRSNPATTLRGTLSQFYDILRMDGHLFLADSVDAPSPLVDVMLLLREIGFTDIDIAWAKDGMWMIGARKGKTITPSANAATMANTITAGDTTAGKPTQPTSSPTSDLARSEASPSYSPVPSPSFSDQRSSHSIISTSAAPSAGSSSSYTAEACGRVAPHLLAKLPQLFARFDPGSTGQLTYKALLALCRSVGRPVNDEDDDESEDSLWWTYQSIATPDKETGSVGISIEDLAEYFYKALPQWNLQHDLEKLRLL